MNEQAIIAKLEAIGPALEKTVEYYSKWEFVSATIYTPIGVLLAAVAGYCGVVVALELKKGLDKAQGEVVVGAGISFFGTLAMAAIILGSNVPDLFYPEAKGIHQLISDLRGK